MNILKLKLASLLAALGLGVSVFFGLTPASIEPTVGAQVYLPYQGGTGTGTAPDTGGKLLISTSSNVYTPAYLTAGSNITIASSSGGITISATGGGGSSTFTGLDFGVIGGSQVKITSQSFDAGMFDLSNTASEGFVRLDWTNGPASRSTANTWSALNTFSAGASVSGSLELAGTASISGAVVIGSGLTGTAKGLVVNNGTSTGNIFEAQDNGSAIFTIADGGKVSAIGTAPGVSAPQYSFIGDTDTGIMRTGANALNIQAGGQYTGLFIGGSTLGIGWSAATVSTGNGTGDVTFYGSGYAIGLAVTGGFKINPNINYGYSTNLALFNSNPTNFTNYSIAGTYATFATHRFGVMNMTGNAGQAIVLTDNATVKIDGEPTVSAGTTQTNSHALWVVGGKSTFGGDIVGGTLRGVDGLGTDITGSTLTIAGGKGTGAGTPGTIQFQASALLGTGTTLQTLSRIGSASQAGWEFSGFASASSAFGMGLSSCTGSNALQWSAGVFSCAAVSGGGSAFNGIGFGTIGATDVNVASIQFDAGMFNLSNTASLGFVRLDWTNGPASRSTANTWADTQTFSSGAVGSFYTDATLGDNGLISGGADVLRFRNAGASAFSITGGSTFIGGTGATTGWASIVNSAGSASTPTYSFVSDENTGMYRAGADILGFSTGGVRRASVSASGWELTGTASISSRFYLPALTAATGTPNSICQNGSEITVNAALTCTVSSAEYKTEIGSFFDEGLVGSSNTTEALDLVAKLQPRQFAYKDQPNRLRWGFLSEEVSAVDPKLGDAIQPDGHAMSIDIAGLIALNTKAIQELYQRSDATQTGEVSDNGRDWSVVVLALLSLGYVVYNEYDKRKNYLKK